MEDNEPHGWSWPARILVGLLTVVVLLFMPLGLSFVEAFTTNTNHVQDALKEVGLFNFFDTIYSPILHILDRFFG